MSGEKKSKVVFIPHARRSWLALTGFEGLVHYFEKKEEHGVLRATYNLTEAVL